MQIALYTVISILQAKTAYIRMVEGNSPSKRVYDCHACRWTVSERCCRAVSKHRTTDEDFSHVRFTPSRHATVLNPASGLKIRMSYSVAASFCGENQHNLRILSLRRPQL